VIASSKLDFPAPFGPEIHASEKRVKSRSTASRYDKKPVMLRCRGIIVEIIPVGSRGAPRCTISRAALLL
jgi:hypothetical protein